MLIGSGVIGARNVACTLGHREYPAKLTGGM
jgi:hypothetical protein